MKRLAVLVLAFLISLCSTVSVRAASSNSYVYDTNSRTHAVPEPYETRAYLNGGDCFGGLKLSAPSDLYVAQDQLVYILDAGNNRIVVLDENFLFVRAIVLKEDGQNVAFLEAKGLFVSKEGTIYVADKKGGIVYVADNNGIVTAKIGTPPEDQVDDDFEYTPSSVVADTAGIVYVISSSSYSGALQYDAAYNFVGFYGSEQVAVTSRVLLNEFWKKILSDEAASGLTRNVPTSIIGLDIDQKNFIYTLRGGSSISSSGQLRKLNTLGANVLFDQRGTARTYGDTDTYYNSSKNITVSSALTDLAVDESGFITLLDRTYNRLFQYDQSANLLYAFGGSEKRYGNFISPVAVDTLKDQILVLDDNTGVLTVMRPTAFAKNVRQAILLNEDGRFADAQGYWEEVLKMDAYYGLANYGMGMVYEELKEYEKAMSYYELANDKQSYSSAFSTLRDDWTKSYFVYILFGVIAFLLLMVVAVNYFERHKKNDYDRHVTKYGYPAYCLKHPFKAYYELKIDRRGSLLLSNMVLAFFFLLSVINRQLTSFHFSDVNETEFNVFLSLGMTIGLFLLFVICNWAVSTLADGEGTLKEIWVSVSYALIPYCILLAAMTALSHVFSLEEGIFWTVFWVLGVIWTAIHIFMAVKEVHQYTAKRTLLILAVTLLGMYLLILIITLGYSLFTQLLGFIGTVYNELRLK